MSSMSAPLLRVDLRREVRFQTRNLEVVSAGSTMGEK